MKNKERNFLNDCEWVYTKPIYHRGKFDNKKVYENTIEAYKESCSDLAPFEFDVQLTGDLEVVCFHDDSLKRMFNRERLVREISYKRLNKLRDDVQVPLLKDVLKLVDGKVELMIELKNSKRYYNKVLVQKVYELLKDYKGKYVIVSFNPFLLKAYKKLDKNAYIGRIGSSESKGIIHYLFVNKHCFNYLFKPDFISYDINNYDSKKIEKYKNKGYKVIGWSLKNKDNYQDLKKYYDNFIIEGLTNKEI